MSTFSEIRSLLQQAPRQPLWFALCDRLDDLPEHERDELALPYIEAYTRRWPALWCEAPQRWIEQALGGDMPPFWGLVRHLNLNCHYLKQAQVEALLGSSLLGRVEVLNLDSNRAGAQIGRILASAPALTGVEELRLGYNQLTRDDLTGLAAAELPALKRLSLDGNPLGPKELGALLSAPWLAQLEGLELQSCPITPAALGKLLARVPKLRAIRLDHIILADGLLELQAIPAGQLRALELYDCSGPRADQIDAFQSALVSLVQRGALDGLESLDAGANALGDAALLALIRAPGIARLERLYLRRSSFSAGAVRKLGDAAFAASLRRVEIPHMDAAREGLAARGVDLDAAVITSG